MVPSPSKSDAQVLENYRVALKNVEVQQEIAVAMANFGYDTTVIAQGKALFTAMRQSYDFNKQLSQETAVKRAAFDAKVEALKAVYMPHRKRAKLVFRQDEVILHNLGLTGSISKVYIKWLEPIRTFYNGLQADSTLMDRLLIFKILPVNVTAALTLIAEMEAARTAYLIKVGESQNATKAKIAAFKQMENWMRKFFAVAKIAMEDKPQLLEALGILIRS